MNNVNWENTVSKVFIICMGYFDTIFSMGMMCFSGGFNKLHNMALVVSENGYVDC